MKLTIQSGDLTKAVSFSASASDEKAEGAYAALLLTASHDSGIRVVGIGAQGVAFAGAMAAVVESGSVMVPTQGFESAVKLLGTGVVEIAVSDGYRIALKCGRRKAELSGAAPDGYPVVSNMSRPVDGAYVSLSGGQVASLVTRVGYARCADKTRPGMGSIMLRRGANGELDAIALDGFQLAVTRLSVGGGSFQATDVALPALAIVALKTLAAGADDIVRVGVSGPYVWCVSHRGEMAARIPEESFPNYEAAIDSFAPELVARATVDRAAAKASFTAVEAMRSRGAKNAVCRMRFGDGTVALDASGSDGAAEDTLDLGDYAPGDSSPELMVNSGRVATALGALDGERVVLRWGASNTPLFLESLDGATRAVVMPMSQS